MFELTKELLEKLKTINSKNKLASVGPNIQYLKCGCCQGTCTSTCSGCSGGCKHCCKANTSR